MNVAKHAYDKIVEVCKSVDFSALIAIYVKFDTLKVADCATINEFGIKFRDIINELAIYSSSSKMDENWLIYKYLGDLIDSNNVRSFIDRWISDHELFDNATKIGSKLDLSDVIHVYEAQCVNFLINANTDGVASLIIGLVVITSRFRFEKSAQQGIALGNFKVLTQTVKWCNGCNKSYHIDAECHVQHFHLKTVVDKKKVDNKKRHEKKQKERQERNKNDKDKTKKENIEES